LGPGWARLDRLVRLHLPVILGVAVLSAFITALVTTPVRRTPGYAPRQPIPFSHELHAGSMRIDCHYCHTGVEISRHAGVPALSVCMNCHSVAAIERPDIERLRQSWTEGRPLAWKRIHRLPDFVFFAHQAHVTAGIDCANCHGDVRRMQVVSQVMSLSMRSCLDCHRNAHQRIPGSSPELMGPENCTACHR
jgi:hypothetical protein